MNILITGHCGFIGTASWNYFVKNNYNVYGIDNLCRKTSVKIEDKQSFILDINDIDKLNVPKIDWIIHLAAQVSVVDSNTDPLTDFLYNAFGTFKVVQFAKKHNASIIYSSTNKVFGDLEGVITPIKDSQPLLPKTNYGVSKCTGANYVLDYHVGNNKKGWVLHQSCIYGESQLGDANQGWVGWIRQCIKNNKDITCFGTGKQVRDLLHVDDLVRLYHMIIQGSIKPGAYVTGGGVDNQVTFEEAVNILGGKIKSYENWRESDQLYFVSDNNGLRQQGWKPEILFKNRSQFL